MRRVLIGVLLGTLVGVGCQRLEAGARETFASKYSCPEERVTTKERSDLRGSRLWPGVMAEPPGEVRRDPGRYAKWLRDQQASLEVIDRANDGYTVFEVRGCDHVSFLGCKRRAKGFKAYCSEGRAP